MHDDCTTITELHCYLCEPLFVKRFEPNAGPLRRVVRSFVTNKVADPTEAYELSCGHTII